MKFEKRQKFAIRKFSVGVASVLIGQFFIGAVANAPVVRASEVIGTQTEKKNVPVVEEPQPKSEPTAVNTDTNQVVLRPESDQSAENQLKQIFQIQKKQFLQKRLQKLCQKCCQKKWQRLFKKNPIKNH